jgi:hypothetical protein
LGKCSRVLCHLTPNDADGPAKGVNHIHQLGFVGVEISNLLLANGGGAGQVGFFSGDALGELPNLGTRRRLLISTPTKPSWWM